MMQIDIHRHFTLIDSKAVEAGRRHEVPIVHAMCGLVVANPYVGRYVEDLGEMIEASAPLGQLMGSMLVAAMGGLPVESYGKAGVVGLGGELEHANALLTTTFANPVREAIGGALAWIPSFTKRAAPGTSIDIPMAHKDALYVRSHYDGMSITLPPEAPDAGEIVLLFCASSRGRLNARVGGLTAAAISENDGLR
jgi:Amino acid synthesis